MKLIAYLLGVLGVLAAVGALICFTLMQFHPGNPLHRHLAGAAVVLLIGGAVGIFFGLGILDDLREKPHEPEKENQHG